MRIKSLIYNSTRKKAVVLHDSVTGLPNREIAIYAEGKKLDIVHSFVYFGRTLAEKCTFDNEISAY